MIVLRDRSALFKDSLLHKGWGKSVKHIATHDIVRVTFVGQIFSLWWQLFCQLRCTVAEVALWLKTGSPAVNIVSAWCSACLGFRTSCGCCRTITLVWIATGVVGKQLQIHTLTGRLHTGKKVDQIQNLACLFLPASLTDTSLGGCFFWAWEC